MAQAVSIKQGELENISRIMMQRKGDVIKIYHYPEFHLFFAFDPILDKNLHVMDINTVGPMIDYYLGERYRITEIKRIDGMGMFDTLKKQADDEDDKPSNSMKKISGLIYSNDVNSIEFSHSNNEYTLQRTFNKSYWSFCIEGNENLWHSDLLNSHIKMLIKKGELEEIRFHLSDGDVIRLLEFRVN